MVKKSTRFFQICIEDQKGRFKKNQGGKTTTTFLFYIFKLRFNRNNLKKTEVLCSG